MLDGISQGGRLMPSSRQLRAFSQPRRGLRRDEAAAYVGVAPTKFDDWVKRGIMPRPKRQDGVVVWDILRLDSAFESLPSEGPDERGGAWD